MFSAMAIPSLMLVLGANLSLGERGGSGGSAAGHTAGPEGCTQTEGLHSNSVEGYADVMPVIQRLTQSQPMITMHEYGISVSRRPWHIQHSWACCGGNHSMPLGAAPFVGHWNGGGNEEHGLASRH
jgi:hypothetical protein